MARPQPPLAGVLLTGGIAIAAMLFALVNWRWLEERRTLEREGIAAIARIDAVTISHKACNSSLSVHWQDNNGHPHSGHFMSCAANRNVGEAIGVLYLADHPDTAMIAEGEGGTPDAQYRTGMLIGAIVAGVMALVTAQLLRRRWVVA